MQLMVNVEVSDSNSEDGNVSKGREKVQTCCVWTCRQRRELNDALQCAFENPVSVLQDSLIMRSWLKQ